MFFFEIIGIFGTVVTLFSLFDIWLEDPQKNKLSEYVFGFHNLTFSEFETNVIRSIMNIYMSDDALSYKKIFFKMTMIGALLYFFFGVFDTLTDNHSSNDISSLIVIFFVYWCSTILLDVWSLSVTKYLFIDKSPKFPYSAIYILLDGFLSFLLPLILGIILFNPLGESSFPAVINVIVVFTGMFLFFGAFTSGLITIIQVLTLVLGIMLRVIFSATRMNTLIGVQGRIHEHPMTFIGVIAGAITAIVVIILKH